MGRTVARETDPRSLLMLFAMKPPFFLSLLLALGLTATAQQPSTAPPRVGVLSIDSRELDYSAATLGSMVRLELQKMDDYEVIDRYDMLDRLGDSLVERDGYIYGYGCYAQRCLLEAAAVLEADLMVSGSVERLGDKILINFKLIDAREKRLAETAIGEYILMPEEIEAMIRNTLYRLLGSDRQPPHWEEALGYYHTVEEPNVTRILNNGPRMGMAYLTGEMADRLQAPQDQGGYAANPYLLQVGYQYEWQYMSASKFQALIEVLGLVSGLEQSMFIPSVVVMNGFREEYFGFEIGFGPSIALRRVAEGYYRDGAWYLAHQWDERDADGFLLPRPPLQTRLDRRGEFQLFSRWVWTVGKTFRAGSLNIPINLYYSGGRNEQMYGISVGFNLQRRRPR